MDKRCLINQRSKEYDSLVGEVELQSTGFRCKCCKCKVNSKFNLLHLNISMHILHTVPHIFLKLPTGRICLTIQSFFIHSASQGFIWNQHNNQHPVGLLAQLVECCTGITRSVGRVLHRYHKIMGFNLIQAWIFFFRPYFPCCSSSVLYCEYPFHIHFFTCSSHIWFSHIHSH